VVANTAHLSTGNIGLRPGDMIHAKPIFSLAELQCEIAPFEPGAAVVLQIEGNDGWGYIAFQME
jgi:hypothetical protein